MKKNSKQLAVSYVVYMMVGSYFYNTKCRNSMEEKRLFMYYAEMKSKEQIAVETKVIKMVEKLNKEFVETIGTLKSEVHLGREGNNYVVKFQTGGFEGLNCKIGVNGEIELLSV